jgi:hypothetical protein
MLSKLNNELLRQGPAALLPQNLSDAWLADLQEKAEAYLDATYDLDVCKRPSDNADPALITCVLELYRKGAGDDRRLKPERLGELLTVYALNLIIESATRHYGLAAPRPDLKNVLSPERIRKLGKKIPELADFLNQACILKASKPRWIDTIKEKILSGLRSDYQPQAGD